MRIAIAALLCLAGCGSKSDKAESAEKAQCTLKACRSLKSL